MKWWERMNEQLVYKGWTVAELHRRSGVALESLYKYSRGEVEKPRGDTLPALADTLDTTELWLLLGEGSRWVRVPIVGYVIAGEEFRPVDDHAPGGGLGTLDLDFDAADPIAVEVRGASNWPVYRQGDKLLCSRHRGNEISSQIGKDCVVVTSDGSGYVKLLMRGSRKNTYTLRSYSPDFPDIEDVELSWVAPVLWVRRGS